MRFRLALGMIILTISYGWSLQASTVYNETAQGDLSNSGLNPTRVTVAVGSNQIFGTTGRDANGIDRDYFTITVPTGLQMTSLIELAGTSVGGAVSFLGMQAGSQVTVPTSAVDATGLLEWTHYGGATTDTDILPGMSISTQGSSGFTPPLSAGDYSFWIQDFNTGRFSYGFDLVLAPVASSVPEPRYYAMMVAGFVALFFMCTHRGHF